MVGKTDAALTDFPMRPAPAPAAPAAVAAAPAPARHKRWKSDTLLPRAVPEAKKVPVRKVTKMCKIPVERPGEPTQVYHTKATNEVMP